MNKKFSKSMAEVTLEVKGGIPEAMLCDLHVEIYLMKSRAGNTQSLVCIK